MHFAWWAFAIDDLKPAMDRKSNVFVRDCVSGQKQRFIYTHDMTFFSDKWVSFKLCYKRTILIMQFVTSSMLSSFLEWLKSINKTWNIKVGKAINIVYEYTSTTCDNKLVKRNRKTLSWNKRNVKGKGFIKKLEVPLNSHMWRGAWAMFYPDKNNKWATIIPS